MSERRKEIFNNAMYENSWIPTAEAVYVAKSKLKRKLALQQNDPAESLESLMNFMQNIDFDAEQEACRCFIPMDFVTISPFITVIPFTCLFLLNEACSTLQSA